MVTYDGWSGYAAERARFYAALAPAHGNAIAYSGDTHAAYAAMMPGHPDALGAEYNCAGVTSPSYERGALLPLELFNTGMLAGRKVRCRSRIRLGVSSTVAAPKQRAARRFRMTSQTWSLCSHHTC